MTRETHDEGRPPDGPEQYKSRRDQIAELPFHAIITQVDDPEDPDADGIYADASTRWRNPQARLLEGGAWQVVRADVPTTLELPGDPAALLAGHARTLDAAYREVGGRLAVNSEVSIDDDGKIHLTGVKAIEEPPSLVDRAPAPPRCCRASTCPR
jgi:hypothetical protein